MRQKRRSSPRADVSQVLCRRRQIMSWRATSQAASSPGPGNLESASSTKAVSRLSSWRHGPPENFRNPEAEDGPIQPFGPTHEHGPLDGAAELREVEPALHSKVQTLGQVNAQPRAVPEPEPR